MTVERSSAVPVLPATRTPGTAAPMPVPLVTTERIAWAMKCPVGTVKTQMRSALEKLIELKPDKNQDRVAKVLVKMAMGDAPLVREDALRALSIWGTRDSATAFLELLSEKVHQERRQRAELGLGAVKDPRGGPAVARFAAIDWPVSTQALMDMGSVAEESVLELLFHERLDIRRDAVKCLKLWGSKQKSLPALQNLLQRDRANLERDILDAIAAIRERPNLPRKPLTQPVK